jgi:hypothetical protein
MRALSLCDTLVAADNLTRTLADQGKCTEAEEMEMESEVPAARKRVLEDKNQDTWKPLEAWRAPSRAEETTRQRVESTEVKYPLLCACSSSAALTAAGLHTHVRTHRTSSDPAYLHTYVYLCMKREEEECCYFRNPGLKRTFG